MTLPWDADYNALIYVLSGKGKVGKERASISSGQLAVLDGTGPVWLAGDEQARGVFFGPGCTLCVDPAWSKVLRNAKALEV